MQLQKNYVSKKNLELFILFVQYFITFEKIYQKSQNLIHVFVLCTNSGALRGLPARRGSGKPRSGLQRGEDGRLQSQVQQ